MADFNNKNNLEIRDLTKEYKDFKLDHISFSLPSGCIMGLIGENGAGKSTTIKLIMDTIKRDEGEIFLFGKDNRSNFKAIKEDIGVVLDETGFPEWITVNELNRVMNATYRNWDEEMYLQYTQRFSLPEKKKFKEYSRGMKMKLAITVALSHHPKLLILDEATSGLDPIIRDEILDIFMEFTSKEEHSILVSSHIVSDLEKICDYIAFLHKGKLVFCEEKDRLLETYGMIHCTKEEIETLSKAAVIGKRENRYGVDVLIKRDGIPDSIHADAASIEDIMLFTVKGV